MTLHSVAVAVHVGGGIGAVVLGVVAILLAKFGPRGRWHRRVGRLYLLLLGASSLLGVPLAYHRDNLYLVLVGLFTATFLVFGWRTIRLARVVWEPIKANSFLRQHVIWMGASYIGAWSGFFANNFLFGTSEPAIWFYAFGPTVLGAIALVVAVPRVRWPS